MVARAALAELLGVDEARLTIVIRPEGDSRCQMTILVDGKEPRGRHRELVLQWARRADGKLVGSA